MFIKMIKNKLKSKHYAQKTVNIMKMLIANENIDFFDHF